MFFKPINIILSGLLLVGCTVLEDRDSCPGRLDLIFMRQGAKDSSEVYLSAESDTKRTSMLSVLEGETSSVTITIERDTAEVRAVCGAGDCLGFDNEVTIPLGRQSPKVWTGRRTLNATGVYRKDTLLMRKEYCLLKIILMEPLSIMIRGDVNGLDNHWHPTKGPFQVRVEGEEPTICIPRQDGGSLVLDLMESQSVLSSFNLSAYLQERGYDWTKPVLDDLVLTIDYLRTEGRLILDCWRDSAHFDLYI